MSVLSDLINAYAEGQGAREWGPGWREKLELLRAQAARYNAQADKAEAPVQRPLLKVQRGDGGEDVLDPTSLAKVYASTGKPAPPEEMLELSVPGPNGEKRRIQVPASALRGQGIQEYVPPRDPKSPGEGRGTGRQVMINGLLSEWFPATGEVVRAPQGAKTVVDNRQHITQRGLFETAKELLALTDVDLARYEESVKGIGRYLPTKDRYVAANAYKSRLGSIAQLFGRTILNDARVSNEDRAVYQGAIGVNGEILMSLEPTEARRRLDQIVAFFEKKYGQIMAQGGGAAPSAPGGADDFSDICAKDPEICGGMQ